jgi:hypothetical protein
MQDRQVLLIAEMPPVAARFVSTYSQPHCANGAGDDGARDPRVDARTRPQPRGYDVHPAGCASRKRS